jgi:hypothetical protein
LHCYSPKGGPERETWWTQSKARFRQGLGDPDLLLRMWLSD